MIINLIRPVHLVHIFKQDFLNIIFFTGKYLLSQNVDGFIYFQKLAGVLTLIARKLKNTM